MRKLIVDRFEGDFAVCEMEDKSFINIEKEKLPIETKEGDSIIEENGIYSMDKEGTQKRIKSINEKFRKLIK